MLSGTTPADDRPGFMRSLSVYFRATSARPAPTVVRPFQPRWFCYVLPWGGTTCFKQRGAGESRRPCNKGAPKRGAPLGRCRASAPSAGEDGRRNAGNRRSPTIKRCLVRFGMANRSMFDSPARTGFSTHRAICRVATHRRRRRSKQPVENSIMSLVPGASTVSLRLKKPGFASRPCVGATKRCTWSGITVAASTLQCLSLSIAVLKAANAGWFAKTHCRFSTQIVTK